MRLPIFLQQMALRTGAIFIVKVLGALARIPLFRLLGAEGVGLYQMAYSFYGLILTLIAGGFPTALSLMTAKNANQGARLFKLSFSLLGILGMVIGFLAYKFSPDIALYLGDSQLTAAIQCIAPALVIAPLLALTRGFIQGMELYGSIAVSEIIEQVVRVVTMLALAALWVGYGNGFAVGGAVFGAFTGGIVALLFLLILLRDNPAHMAGKSGERITISTATLFSLLFQASLAILTTRLIVPALEFLDVLIIPHRLQASGLTVSQSTAVFGEIAGMATTVVHLPTIITAALSHTLAAKITGDWKNKKSKQFLRRCQLAINLGWMWGIGSSLFLYLYPYEISRLLFGTEQAVMAVRYMALIPVLTGVREITTTILWAQERQKDPIIGLILGSCVSVPLCYLLSGIPGFGYEGAVIGILSMEVVAVIWNMAVLKRDNRAIFLLIPLIFETLLLLFGGFAYYLAINYFMLHVSPPLMEFVRYAAHMLVFYGGVTAYLIFRFLKMNNLKLFT